MPVPPYNTGKVKIGIYYVPKQQNFNTETTDHWQGVFLGERSDFAGEFWRWLLLIAVFAALGYWGFR